MFSFNGQSILCNGVLQQIVDVGAGRRSSGYIDLFIDNMSAPCDKSSLVSGIPAHRALWKGLNSFVFALVKVGSGAFSDIVFAMADRSPERKFLGPFRDVFRGKPICWAAQKRP